MNMLVLDDYRTIVEEICQLNWDGLNRQDLETAALAYYYFSIQFRESLEVACEMLPEDPKLATLRREECDTANLSPWPNVAQPGERMNHDEFMRRTVALVNETPEWRTAVDAMGRTYLERTRGVDREAKARSIASYEDGGLEAVFTAILRAPVWDGAALGAFRHFLTEHIRFDSDPDQGHGALSRHLVPDGRVRPMWIAFRDLLTGAVPALSA
ncbi:MAG: hypothetical protein JOY70_01535 [Acidisphaera sp.]|nr:hypothetical protein [Acidisphaera sp.]MBV9811543.1 hypothetical protein [Acetobacteraceae bacterium]